MALNLQRKCEPADEQGELRVTFRRTFDDDERRRALERVCDLLLQGVTIKTTDPEHFDEGSGSVASEAPAYEAERNDIVASENNIHERLYTTHH